MPECKEVILSRHSTELWERREEELASWIATPKQRMQPKKVQKFLDCHVDAELYSTLMELHKKGLTTEFSCSGVSDLDEPEDHSLYAYITMPKDSRTEHFVAYAMQRVSHLLLVTFESERDRYDLSSFFIQHNRLFCQWMQACAEDYTYHPNIKL